MLQATEQSSSLHNDKKQLADPECSPLTVFSTSTPATSLNRLSCCACRSLSDTCRHAATATHQDGLYTTNMHCLLATSKVIQGGLPSTQQESMYHPLAAAALEADSM